MKKLIILLMTVSFFAACTKVDVSNEDVLDILSLEEFNNNTKAGVSMVFFHASWCHICKDQRPFVEEVAKLQELESVFFGQVEFDDHKDITTQSGVSSFPTIIIYKDGVEVERLTGKGHDTDKLKNLINQHL